MRRRRAGSRRSLNGDGDGHHDGDRDHDGDGDRATDTSGADDSGDSTVTFQMPSGNIGCLFGFRQLRCDILSGLEPEPTETCEFDWVGVDLGATGPAAANCGSDTVYDGDAPTLAYGSTWSRGGIVCESDERALLHEQRGPRVHPRARSWSAF